MNMDNNSKPHRKVCFNYDRQGNIISGASMTTIERDGIVYELHKNISAGESCCRYAVAIVRDSSKIEPDVMIPVYEYQTFKEKFGGNRLIGHDGEEYPVTRYVVDGWSFRIKLGIGVYHTSAMTDEIGIEIFDFEWLSMMAGKLEIPGLIKVGIRRFRTLRISGRGDWPDNANNSPFNNLAAITSLHIPSSVTTLDHAGFNGLTGIKFLALPENLVTVQGKSFCGCTSLEKVRINGKLGVIELNFLNGCPNLKEIEVEDLQAFTRLSVFMLTDRPEHDSWLPLWQVALHGSSPLNLIRQTLRLSEGSELTIDETCGYFDLDLRNVEKLIYDSPYSPGLIHADNLRELEIMPQAALSIDMQDIKAPKLKRLTLHGVISAIDTLSTETAESIEEIIYAPMPQDLGDFDIDQLIIHRYALRLCRRISKLQIPDGYKEIEEYACHGCISLAELSVPDSMLKIGAYAFADSHKLKNVTVPADCDVDPLAFAPETIIKRV